MEPGNKNANVGMQVETYANAGEISISTLFVKENPPGTRDIVFGVLSFFRRGWFTLHLSLNAVYNVRMYVWTYIHSYILTHTQLASERPKREASAPLTAVSQVNGDSKSSNERDPFLVGSLGFSCRYKRFKTWLWLLYSA